MKSSVTGLMHIPPPLSRDSGSFCSRLGLLLRLMASLLASPAKLLGSLNRKKIRKFLYYYRTTSLSVLQEKVERNLAAVPLPDRAAVPDILPLPRSPAEVEGLNFPAPLSPRLSIVIPVWNKWDHTCRCLRSLYRYGGGEHFEIIVVDNGSTDETSAVLDRMANVKIIRNTGNLGFTAACNAGAAASSGSHILFLNNDTQIMEGCLQALLELIERYPHAGAVGARLLYPDGRLQEAGGIVWDDPDSLAWNFGRYDDPCRWEYNYVKEVDYCSGACLLVRREAFERAGAFDPLYSPAYCEDTDLAFAIRKAGYKVLYQPRAAVVHFEGVTAGRDVGKGIKQHQVANQRKFYQKWRSCLKQEHSPVCDNLFLARDRSRGRRVLLFVDRHVPTYDRDAGSARMYEYLKIFVHLGFKIIFWPDDLEAPEPYTGELQQMGVEVVYGPQNFNRCLREWGRHIDVAYLSRPDVAGEYMGAIRRHSKAKIFYDGHDLCFLREKRRAEVERSERLLEAAAQWKKVEYGLVRRCDQAIVLSTVEKEMLDRDISGAHVTVMPYVQPEGTCRNAFAARSDLLFIGGFAHIPNEDAVLWFLNSIFPLLRSAIPGIRLTVIGSHPTGEIRRKVSGEVEIAGFVSDPGPYFERARVFVAPLRYGAGFKGKIIHAMSYGLPVVTTSMGAEGMGLKDGENVLIADDPEHFARRVREVYQDRELWSSLSYLAREHVRMKYSSGAAEERFARLFASAGIPLDKE